MADPKPAQLAPCSTDADQLAKLRRAGLDPTRALSSRQVLRWYEGMRGLVSMTNTVVPYVYGRCAFADMADALASATAAEHRIYLIGWWVESNTVLKEGTPPVLLGDLLTNTKASVRGMFWFNPKDPGGDFTYHNEPIVKFINALPNGAAIHDQKLPSARFGGTQTDLYGFHHQKILVVAGASGIIGFVGGMDVNNSRVTPNGDDQPLHDVHLRVQGLAALRLLDVFAERWRDHPDAAGLDLQKFGLSPVGTKNDFDRTRRAPEARTPLATVTSPTTKPKYSDMAVAIGRTYADLGKFSPNQSYEFAPKGEETAWALIASAIQNARERIYIEDQYLVSRRLKAALLAKLREPQFKSLTILMENSVVFERPNQRLWLNEFPFLIAARNEIRVDFAKVDPRRQKWRMFSLRTATEKERQTWCGNYVHAKMFIVDDELAIVGSANADDRGYTFDSEVLAAVTDDPVGRAAGNRFARDLRIMLWHKHLGAPHAELADWGYALRYWNKLPASAMVFDNSELEDSPLLGAKPVLRDFPQIDKIWRESVDPDADLLP